MFAVHEYEVPNPQRPTDRPWKRQFTCLNDKDDGTPCPACDAGMKQKLRGVYNIIQRQRPIFRKDKDGKAIYVNNEPIIDGHEDTVVILNVPSTTAEVIRRKDADYNGLMSRDLKIRRSSDTFQPWDIEPADIDSGAVPMSEADQELAKQKHDLDEFMQPPPFQEAARIVAKETNRPPQSGGGSQPQGQPQAGEGGGSGNAFADALGISGTPSS